MKVDELLKQLENVKINDNKIDEKRKIAKHIAKIFGKKERRWLFYYITKGKKIYNIIEYEDLLNSNRISPNDVYILVVENEYNAAYDPVKYYHPLLRCISGLIIAYLSKLGFDSLAVKPATGLKYVAVFYRFPEINREIVEITDIDTFAFNIRLQTLVYVVSTKYSIADLGYDWVKDIMSQIDSRKPFGGHGISEAEEIIDKYYTHNDASLARDVEDIKGAYNRIFQPYRVVYDPKTKRFW